jgi:inosose dehydratase
MLRTERVAIAGNVPADGSASLAEEGIRQIATSAGRVAQIASEYGIIAHYHNHVGTWIEAPDEVSSLLPHLQEAGIDLCFDTGHYAYGGGDSAAFLSDHIRDIGYLHLKDVDGAMVQKARSRGLSFLDALRHYVFTPLGTGTANIAGILATLVERQFPGWIVIEQDTCTGDNTMTARQNLAFFRQETEKRIQA